MLIMLTLPLYTNTLPNRKDRIMKTSMNFLSEMNDRKESEEGKYFSKQMCVSSQKIRMRKEEGATVAATPTFPQRAVDVGPDGQFTETSPNHWERLIKYHKCPTFDAKRDF